MDEFIRHPGLLPRSEIAADPPTDMVLDRFVRDSNAIEGIDDPPYGPRTPQYDDHMDAARAVARHELEDIFEIHRILTARLLPPHQVGIPRAVQVGIAGHLPPAPGAHLRRHLARLASMLVAGPRPGEDGATFAWRIHDEFECVHPFVDGNGRTGRLLLNAVRLRYGAEWLTIRPGAEQRAYYRGIMRYQLTRFVCSEQRTILSELGLEPGPDMELPR